MLLEAHPVIGVKLLSCFLQSLSEKITRSNEVRLHTADYANNVVTEPLYKRD